MLRRWILKIRHKPKHVRDSYALGIAAVTTTLVAAVWLYHWPAMIEARQQARRSEVAEVPTTSFLEQAKEQIATARESIDLEKLSESASSTTEDAVDVRTIDFGAAFASMPKKSTTTPNNLAATTTVQLPFVATTTTSSAVVQ